MTHHSLVVDFSYLNFEKIDTEILADEAKEQEETEVDAIVEKDSTGKDTIGGKDTDESIVPLLRTYISFSFIFFGKQWLLSCFGV